MLRKFFVAITIILLVLTISILIPIEKINLLQIFGLTSAKQFAALEVYSLGGDMKVIVDGKDEGVVSETEGKFELSPIDPGSHTIRLERITTIDDFYAPFETQLKFVEGFTVVISWEIGPSQELSSGWILTAQQEEQKKGTTTLSVSSDTGDVKVEIDQESHDIPLEDSEISLSNEVDLKFSTHGAQDLNFELFSSDSKQREQLQNYKLFLYVNLFKIPIESASQG